MGYELGIETDERLHQMQTLTTHSGRNYRTFLPFRLWVSGGNSNSSGEGNDEANTKPVTNTP